MPKSRHALRRESFEKQVRLVFLQLRLNDSPGCQAKQQKSRAALRVRVKSATWLTWTLEVEDVESECDLCFTEDLVLNQAHISQVERVQPLPPDFTALCW